MAFQDGIGLAGRVEITLIDALGRVVQTRRHDNLVTLQGRELMARCLSGLATLGGRLEMAIGSGSAQQTLEDKALQQETARVTAASPELMVLGEGNARRSAVRVRASFPASAGSSEGITEAGIWVEQVGGPPVLFNRTTFPVITRSEHLELSLSWEVLF